MAQRVTPPDDLDGFPTTAAYVDAYAAPVPDAQRRTAREWADAILAVADPAVLARIRAAQRATGLRLVDPAPPNVALGWRVVEERPDHLLLGVEGRFYTPTVSFSVRADALLLTTAVEPHGTVGRVVWALGAPMHRLAARTMAGLAQRVANGGPAASS